MYIIKTARRTVYIEETGVTNNVRTSAFSWFTPAPRSLMIPDLLVFSPHIRYGWKCLCINPPWPRSEVLSSVSDPVDPVAQSKCNDATMFAFLSRLSRTLSVDKRAFQQTICVFNNKSLWTLFYGTFWPDEVYPDVYEIRWHSRELFIDKWKASAWVLSNTTYRYQCT